MTIRLAERELRTKYGTYTEILYYDGQKESIALVMGDVKNEGDVLCRIHSHCIGAHVFNSVECTCREEMEASQSLIEREGRGIIIWLDQEGKGNGHLALIESIQYKKAGFSQAEAYVKAGYKTDARDYHAVSDVLEDLNVKSIVLLTSNPEKAEDLRRLSVEVSGVKEIRLA